MGSTKRGGLVKPVCVCVCVCACVCVLARVPGPQRVAYSTAYCRCTMAEQRQQPHELTQQEQCDLGIKMQHRA
eukprot:1090821-Pelagomonas_calceolata.AAC.3